MSLPLSLLLVVVATAHAQTSPSEQCQAVCGDAGYCSGQSYNDVCQIDCKGSCDCTQWQPGAFCQCISNCEGFVWAVWMYIAVVVGGLCLLCGLPCLCCYCCGRATARGNQYTVVTAAAPGPASPSVQSSTGHHTPYQQPAGWQQPNAHPAHSSQYSPLVRPAPSAPAPQYVAGHDEPPPSYSTFQVC
jgi:hypothetical protein